MQGDAPKKRKSFTATQSLIQRSSSKYIKEKKKKTELEIMQRTVERTCGDGIDSLRLMSLRR